VFNIRLFEFYLEATFAPSLSASTFRQLDVELHGALTLGETVAHFHPRPAQPHNMLASVGVDSERFIQLFLQRIEDHFA
jgi:inosine-uridine nucleoside N-ribohydrolase